MMLLFEELAREPGAWKLDSGIFPVTKSKD